MVHAGIAQGDEDGIAEVEEEESDKEGTFLETIFTFEAFEMVRIGPLEMELAIDPCP